MSRSRNSKVKRQEPDYAGGDPSEPRSGEIIFDEGQSTSLFELVGPFDPATSSKLQPLHITQHLKGRAEPDESTDLISPARERAELKPATAHAWSQFQAGRLTRGPGSILGYLTRLFKPRPPSADDLLLARLRTVLSSVNENTHPSDGAALIVSAITTNASTRAFNRLLVRMIETEYDFERTPVKSLAIFEAAGSLQLRVFPSLIRHALSTESDELAIASFQLIRALPQPSHFDHALYLDLRAKVKSWSEGEGGATYACAALPTLPYVSWARSTSDLVGALRHESRDVRYGACMALLDWSSIATRYRAPHERARRRIVSRALFKHLNDEDARMQYSLVWTLGYVVTEHELKETAAAVARLFDSADNRVAAGAVRGAHSIVIRFGGRALSAMREAFGDRGEKLDELLVLAMRSAPSIRNVK